MSQSLFLIESALRDLFDTRAELLDQVAFTDQQIEEKNGALDAVDAAIVEWVTKEVRKVDGISRLLIEWKAQQAALCTEIGRLKSKLAGLERDEVRLENIVLRVMRDCDVKKLEGDIGTLRRQGNGGVQGVDVRQPDLVPLGMMKITVTLPVSEWEWCLEAAEDTIRPLKTHSISSVEPDLTAIGEQLRKRVPCPNCKGKAIEHNCDGLELRLAECGQCKGEGTIPGSVPGCVLRERGERLRAS